MNKYLEKVAKRFDTEADMAIHIIELEGKYNSTIPEHELVKIEKQFYKNNASQIVLDLVKKYKDKKSK